MTNAAPVDLLSNARASRPLATREARTLHDYATWWLSAILVTTLLGFQATTGHKVGQLQPVYIVHGVSSLAWLVVLIVQHEFIRRRRRDRHRSLATVGVLCAMLLSITALPMMQSLAAKAAARPGGGGVAWFLVTMDAGMMLIFLGAFAVAVANVRTPAVHSRAMASTAFMALAPGLGRLLMVTLHIGPQVASCAALGVGLLLLLALIISDRRAGVRDHVYPAMFAAIALVTLGSGPLASVM